MLRRGGGWVLCVCIFSFYQEKASLLWIQHIPRMEQKRMRQAPKCSNDTHLRNTEWDRGRLNKCVWACMMQHVFGLWMSACMCSDRAGQQTHSGTACSPPAPTSLAPSPSSSFLPSFFLSHCLLSSLPISSFFCSLRLSNLFLSWQHQQLVLSAAIPFWRASKGICSVRPRSVPHTRCLLTCCLSCRSLLCAGGLFSPPEEAGLLPHTDLHPSYHGCRTVTSLFLDQQRVCSCTHSCWYAPSSLMPSLI